MKNLYTAKQMLEIREEARRLVYSAGTLTRDNWYDVETQVVQAFYALGGFSCPPDYVTRTGEVIRPGSRHILLEQHEVRPQFGDREGGVCRAVVRFDWLPGNKAPYLSVTGEFWGSKYLRAQGGSFSQVESEMCGCIHDKLRDYFPELHRAIDFHLANYRGPSHYLANTIYMAGDRDCNGQRKGEVRAYDYSLCRKGTTESLLPGKRLFNSPEDLKLVVEASGGLLEVLPVPVVISEGKERELEHARSIAIWPDAPEDLLTAEPPVLARALIIRLPDLLNEFAGILQSFEVCMVKKQTEKQ